LKQTQHRPKTRAPHGKPEHSARISLRCTPELKSLFDKKGGSEKARIVLEKHL